MAAPIRPITAGAVAGLSGFAVMCLELTAIRLLAPHFGDSAHVWTNVIGVMLVALAAGAWIGGRLADRGHGGRRLSVLLVLAAALVAVVPLVVRPLGAALLPQTLPLDAAMGALVRGSLAATLLLFGPPVLLLGATTPLLVARLADADGRVGHASGLVSALATLGSLAGTFLATHVLVPGLGSRATVWACAAVLIVCAALVARRPARAAAAVLPLGLALVPVGPLRVPAAGEELLAEVESSYQYLQVVRVRPSATAPAETLLRINEGLDSFHSVAVDGSPWTGGRYYDWHAVAPYLAGDGAAPPDLRVLSLGAAAGTFRRVLAAACPDAVVDGVEIDPEVPALGERWFATAPSAPGHTFSGLDARTYVNEAEARYDVVLVDAYARQIYIPAHVASAEFFAAVADRLRPGGVVSVNVGALTADDPVVCTVAQTMAGVFGRTWVWHVPRSRNFMLVARQGRALDPQVLNRVDGGDETLRELCRTAAAGTWREVLPGERMLRDDRPFLDRLQEAAYRGHDEGGLTTMAGDEAPDEAAARARALLQQDRPREALAALATARQPTAWLRFLAGDCRWSLREVTGALREYEEAERLGVEPSLAPALAERLQGVRADRAERQRAVDVATRNGWLVVLLAVLFGGGALAWRSTC